MRIGKAILAAACAIYGCLAQADDLSTSESAVAKKIYTSKCARCHKFYEPGDYAAPEWRAWMIKMRKKARLQTDDYELLLRYTEQLRSGSKGTIRTESQVGKTADSAKSVR